MGLSSLCSLALFSSLPAHDFEKKASGFEHHVKKEHSMWSYLYFMMHLRTKPPQQYTAAESYVAKMLSDTKTELKWFPVNHALSIEQAKDEVCWSDICSFKS